MNFILSIIARLLFVIISPMNFIYVVFIKNKFSWKRLNGYWLSDATAIDRYGNYNFRSFWNVVLRKENGYEFGNFEQTISEVLQRNHERKTLTKTGKLLYKIIDKIDKGHFDKL